MTHVLNSWLRWPTQACHVMSCCPWEQSNKGFKQMWRNNLSLVISVFSLYSIKRLIIRWSMEWCEFLKWINSHQTETLLFSLCSAVIFQYVKEWHHYLPVTIGPLRKVLLLVWHHCWDVIYSNWQSGVLKLAFRTAAPFQRPLWLGCLYVTRFLNAVLSLFCNEDHLKGDLASFDGFPLHQLIWQLAFFKVQPTY